MKRIVALGFVLVVVIVSGCSSGTGDVATSTKRVETMEPRATAVSTEPEKQESGRGEVATEEVTPAAPPGDTDQPTGVMPSRNPIPRLQAGDPVTIRKVAMANQESGWAIGSALDGAWRVLRTSDGGETWWDASPPEGAPSAGETKPADGFFLDEDTAWVAYHPYEIIWASQDGGETWQGARTTLSTQFGVTIWFENSTHGWMMKPLDAGMNHVYIALYRTTSAGSRWEVLFDPYSSDELQSFSKTGMVFSGETGWVTRDSSGVSAAVFLDVSHDGGRTWEEIDLEPPSSSPGVFEEGYCGLYSPTLFTSQHGVFTMKCKVFRDDETLESHFIYETEDGGTTWETRDYPGGELTFVDREVVYALGRDIHRSNDGGHTWTLVKSVNWDGEFSFVDRETAWAVAEANNAFALVQTSDGCNSFREVEPQVIAAKTPVSAAANEPSITSGQIAFLREDPSDPEIRDIFLVNTDGSGLTRVTDGSGWIEAFTWSPEGERIAFDSDRDGEADIYAMNVDGSGLVQLTNSESPETDPAWSSVGERIAYVRRVSADTEILIMNADGTDQRVLTDGETPAWSPDGEWIAFAVLGDGIFAMRSDGSEKKRLTDSSANTYDWHPVWSPDGSEILFASNRHQPDWAAYEAVYVMNTDGSGMGQLTSPWSVPPYSWSPDGALIVYAQYGSDGPELYRVDANGVESEPLIPDNAGVHPQWRP